MKITKKEVMAWLKENKWDDAVVEVLSSLRCQGIILTCNGNVFMASKNPGDRLKILDAAKTEMLYDEAKRKSIVMQMIEQETGKVIKYDTEVNYIG